MRLSSGLVGQRRGGIIFRHSWRDSFVFAMNGMANFPLLFQWEPPRARRGAIILFLILSLLAHAFCFYLFQVVYPPTVALLPPPARVSLVAADSAEGQTLLSWIESEDPALAFTTVRPTEGKLRALPKIAHVPSYRTHQPMLKEAPPLAVDLNPPSARPPAPIPIVRRNVEPLTNQKIPTTISFSDELSSLGAAIMPPFKLTASNTEAPQNMRFRVAVAPGGEVHYCFPLTSSGDAALDEQARQAIALCRFPGTTNHRPPMANALVWGIVTLDWGNDVAPPSATPTSAPIR